MATPPTPSEIYESAFDASLTTRTTGTFNVATGDVLVAVALVEYSRTINTPTNTGTALTWTLQRSVAVTDYCGLYVWTAPCPAGQTGITVSAVRSGDTSPAWLLGVYKFTGTDGVGASGVANTSGAPSLTLSTSYDNSALAVFVGDWNAADGASRTWRQVNSANPTEHIYARDAARATLYGGIHGDAGTAGSKTVGLSAPSGQKYSIVGLEVRGVASSGSTATVSQTISALTQAATASASSGSNYAQTISALTQAATASASSGSNYAQTISALTQAATAGGSTSATADQSIPVLTQELAAGAAGGVIEQTLPTLVESLAVDAASEVDTSQALASLTQQVTASADTSAASRLFSTTPPVSAVVDSAVSLGTEFYVNSSGKTLTKIRYLVPSSGANVSATRTCALYSTLDGYNGTMVAGPFTMPSGTAGQWCEYTLATPYALTADTRYRVVVWHDTNAGYPATGGYFTTGDGATTTTIDGFLVRPNTTDALANRQGSYIYGASIDFPNESFSGGNYWTDVEVAADTSVSASLAQSLPALTQEAAAGASSQVAGAQTLAALTQAATTAGSIQASLAQNLAALTQDVTASGTSTSTLSIDQALPALSQAQTLAALADSSISQTLELPTMSATLSSDAATTISQSLPALTQAAVAAGSSQVAGAQSLPTLTQAIGIGASAVSISQSLPALTQAATAAGSSQAAGAQSLPALVQEVVGSAGSAVNGNLSQSLPSLAQAATAAVLATVAVAATLPALGQSATVASSTSEALTQSLPALTQAAAVESSEPVGASAITQSLPALAQALTAALTSSGSLTQTLPAITGVALAYAAPQRPKAKIVKHSTRVEIRR